MKDVAVFIWILIFGAALTGCGETKYTPIAGPQGNPGTPGTGCTVVAVPASTPAPNGGSLIECTDGTSSLVLNGIPGENGTNGVNGTDGSNGTNGLNGSNGTNGTVITPVQFCPGVPQYPTTFPEVGFCINGNIYAVYSANGGFLTQVLSGGWSSDGINDSCNFTVSTGCIITNN
jgi:hypothetical protein